MARNYKQIPDDKNPLITEMDEEWGKPKYLTQETRHILVQALLNGTADEKMQLYVGRLLAKSPSFGTDLLQVSIYRYDIKRISRIFDEGRLQEGYAELAHQLRDGHVDMLFLEFAAERIEFISRLTDLPKSSGLTRYELIYAVGESFEKAAELGITGIEKEDFLESKFNMSFASLEVLWKQYKEIREEGCNITRKEMADNEAPWTKAT